VAPSRHALSAPPLAPLLALRHEFVRKALHVSAALIPIAYSLGVPRGALEMLLVITSTLALLIEGLRHASATADATVNRAFGSLMREHEKRSITGATWLALSCLIVVVVLSRGAAVAALWCVTVGDPVATIAGRGWTASRWARPRARSGKTVAGTLACAAVSFAGVWMLAGYSPAAAAVIAAAGAAAEAIPWRLDDNVVVAGAAGATAQLLA
jgi:dolichol kinase